MGTRPGRLTNPSAYVFLDVDGIINPYARKLGLDGWEVFTIDRFEVWYSDYLRNWLLNLIDNNVQIVWATTWVEHPANLFELADMWGLPTDLPTIFGLAYESRARIAIALRDDLGFERFAQLSARAQGAGRNVALQAKLRRLMREAEAAGVRTTSALRRAGTTLP